MPDPSQTTVPGYTPTVLVVDDETANVKLCAAILEMEGFRVLQATGSSEAIRLCATHDGEIDVLMTDLVLHPPSFRLATHAELFPHVHGHDLALRAAAIRKGLRVLMMSGNPDKELADYGISRGNLPFLQKPFGRESLVRSIREILAAPPPTLGLIVRATGNLTED